MTFDARQLAAEFAAAIEKAPPQFVPPVPETREELEMSFGEKTSGIRELISYIDSVVQEHDVMAAVTAAFLSGQPDKSLIWWHVTASRSERPQNVFRIIFTGKHFVITNTATGAMSERTDDPDVIADRLKDALITYFKA